MQGFSPATGTNKRTAELIFLDVNMPGLSGIDFLESLNDPPVVILTTAYDDYAVKGYELDITDYLLKPFSFERFLEAVKKAGKLLRSETGQQILLVKADRKTYRLNPDEIIYIESIGDYVTIYTTEKKLNCYETLKNLEKSFRRTNSFEFINRTSFQLLK